MASVGERVADRDFPFDTVTAEIQWRIAAAVDKAVQDEREQCALIAKQHAGSAAARRRSRGQTHKTMSPEASVEVEAEERGEDIAAGLIEKAILARSNR